MNQNNLVGGFRPIEFPNVPGWYWLKCAVKTNGGGYFLSLPVYLSEDLDLLVNENKKQLYCRSWPELFEETTHQEWYEIISP